MKLVSLFLIFFLSGGFLIQPSKTMAYTLKAYPNGDVTSPAEWTASSGSDLYSLVNEAVADDDATYIRQTDETNTKDALFTLDFSNVVLRDPRDRIDDVTVYVRGSVESDFTGGYAQGDFKLLLDDGSSEYTANKAFYGFAPGNPGYVVQELFLSVDVLNGNIDWEIDNITSLRVGVRGYGDNPPPFDVDAVRVTQIYLEVTVTAWTEIPYSTPDKYERDNPIVLVPTDPTNWTETQYPSSIRWYRSSDDTQENNNGYEMVDDTSGDGSADWLYAVHPGSASYFMVQGQDFKVDPDFSILRIAIHAWIKNESEENIYMTPYMSRGGVELELTGQPTDYFIPPTGDSFREFTFIADHADDSTEARAHMNPSGDKDLWYPEGISTAGPPNQPDSDYWDSSAGNSRVFFGLSGLTLDFDASDIKVSRIYAEIFWTKVGDDITKRALPFGV